MSNNLKARIQTYDDLQAEKQRLETLLTIQKQQIRSNFEELKVELAPVKQAFGFIGKITRRDKSNPLLNMGIDVAGDMFLRKFLFAKADWVSRLILPFFIKNYSSNLFSTDAGGSLFHKIRNFFKRDKSEDHEDDFNQEPSRP
jgi:hypothetical protein